MDLLKRSSDVFSSDHSDNKRLKLATYEVSLKSIHRRSCLESLPNEVFYEIFDYLDGYDIYSAFSKLNIRFEKLLSYLSISLKVNLPYSSSSTIERRCRDFIIPNRQHLFSLKIDGGFSIMMFLNHTTVDSSFSRLESMHLIDLVESKIFMILFYAKSLPRLRSLTIGLQEDSYYNIGDVYKLIFELPHLEYLKVSMDNFETPDIRVSMSLNGSMSKITCLTIDHPCYLEGLISILQHTPQLCKLTCRNICEEEDSLTTINNIPIELTKLTHIKINLLGIEFGEFESFMKNVSSQLKVLRLSTPYEVSFLDGDRWIRLIKRYMPNLLEFYLECGYGTDLDEMMRPVQQSINEFTSSFWIQKRWYLEFIYKRYQFVFSIQPPKKAWYDGYISEEIINNQMGTNKSQIEAIQPIEFTIESYNTKTHGEDIVRQLKVDFSREKFTHLNIECDGIPVTTLIDIIRLLPNLFSLKILSFPPVQLDSLTMEDTELLLLVSITNRIRKVKLCHIEDINQVFFITNLCPRINYLEIEEPLVRHLDSIMSHVSFHGVENTPFLNCICISVSNGHDGIIKNLKNIIDYERLFFEDKAFPFYTIKRIRNKIFLRWQL